MMKRFTDKVSIITGSSNGIGRATAILFASEGAKVTITGRDAAALKVTKEECLKAGAKEEDILDILGDITKEEIQDRLISETVHKFGKIDVLVNNHGGGFYEMNEAGNLKVEIFDDVMSLNCKSTLSMSVKAMLYLKATKGCIVNVSSIGSTVAAVPNPLYAMAKASLDHMTRIMAFQHAREGIRVNCVNPGFIKTQFLAKLGLDEVMRDKMIEGAEKAAIPCGRVGMPIDIAEPIAFLADNRAAGYITGQTLIIDGGLTMAHVMAGSPELESFRKPKQEQ